MERRKWGPLPDLVRGCDGWQWRLWAPLLGGLKETRGEEACIVVNGFSQTCDEKRGEGDRGGASKEQFQLFVVLPCGIAFS